MEINWFAVVVYVIAILVLYLLYKLIFLIKDTNDPRFGQTAALVMLGLLLESIVLAFSWGWMVSSAAVLIGLFFSWTAKNYRMTIVIAAVAAASNLLLLLNSAPIFVHIYFYGSGVSLISFVYEVIKYRNEAKQV